MGTKTGDPDAVARLGALLEEQAALRRVATLVARDTEPGRLFDCVCEEVGRLLDVEATDILRFEEDRTATVLGTWSANDEPSFPVGSRVPIEGGTVTAKLYRSGRPERVDDYSGVGGELAATIREFGVRSVVGAPVNVAGKLWGAVMVVSGEPFSFPEDTERRIADFAELVTAALANVDAREQLAASGARIVEAGYEERRRLERDLHDGAQQELVGVVLSLKLARQKLTAAPGEASELVDEALERAQAGIRDLRDLAAGIHPSVLTDRGLGAALEALASRSPVPVGLETANTEGLPASVEATAYFLVAEALTNVAKHARAERVDVSLRVESAWLAVEVRDDGIGGADASAGSGLRGLADRVSALGGWLEIESLPGEGTTISARIAVSGDGAARRLQPAVTTPSAGTVRLPVHGKVG
jgi:signal transduction histidine kinase